MDSIGPLFESVTIKDLSLPNRFVRSATNIGAADEDGNITDRHLAVYDELANEGAGLIITGATNVQERGQILPFQKRISKDSQVAGLKRLAKDVHNHGARIAVQLFHGGAEAGVFQKSREDTAVAPSYLPNDAHFPFLKGPYRALVEDEIWEIIAAFGAGAARAREAGIDAVQIHGSHGYLFSQFLSPYTNRREDDWGGTLDNRLRFHREVARSIREAVGEDYPIFIKIGVQDSIHGGLEFDEGKRASKKLAEMGYDALEISSGARGSGWRDTEFRKGIRKIDDEAYYRSWAREIRTEVKVPVLLAGGLRTFELMEEIVGAGDADLVSLSRPLIREPHLIGDWKRGDRRRSSCISCNACIISLTKNTGVYCLQQGKDHT